MSLRDQLLAKGLASKKDARRVQRDLKKKRKSEQGSRKRKHVLAKEAQAAKRQAADARHAERQAERAQREQARDRYERALQIRNLLVGNRVRNKGEHRFHHLAVDRRTILTMHLHRKVADQLRLGALCIAVLDHGTRQEYVLIGSRTAERLEELGAADLLVHRASGTSADHEALMPMREWDTSLVPHRVRGATTA